MYDLVCKQVMVLPGAPHTPFIIVKEYPWAKTSSTETFHSSNQMFCVSSILLT